jgi:hypothetical protein
MRRNTDPSQICDRTCPEEHDRRDVGANGKQDAGKKYETGGVQCNVQACHILERHPVACRHGPDAEEQGMPWIVAE